MPPIQGGTSTVWPRLEIGKSSVKPWTRPITIAGRKFTDWSTSSGPSASEPEALDEASEGVEANARLTASIAVVLLVLLAAEGITVLRVRTLLTPHVFLGMLLIPLILLKIGSTGYRFFRYYAGSPAYRRRGPPPAILRLLGPFVVLLTIVLFASGVALSFVGPGLRQYLLLLHKVSFVLWFGAMAVHVLGHFRDTVRLAPKGLYWPTRAQVGGGKPEPVDDRGESDTSASS